MLSLMRTLQGEFDVTLLARAQTQDELEHARELEQYCARFIPVMAPEKRSVFHSAAFGMFYHMKSTIMRRSLKQIYDCPGVLLRAARMLSSEQYDFVIISFWQLYRMAKVFPVGKTALITYDIDMLMNHQISLLERNLVRKVQAVRKWLMERPEELAAYRSTKHVWTVSEPDKSVAEKICRDNCSVAVVPFAIDMDFYAPSGMERNKGEILFLGQLDEASNRDALEFFIRKIYPHLDEIPGLSITIVGGNLPDGLESFGLLSEVEVVGRASDVRPYLHRASCLVAPSRFGGGLRIGLLQAMAAGLPVVSSPVAVNGLPFTAGEEYLSAIEPKEYASQIASLMKDVEVGSAMAARAMQLVDASFGMGSQKSKVAALVRGAMSSG